MPNRPDSISDNYGLRPATQTGGFAVTLIRNAVLRVRHLRSIASPGAPRAACRPRCRTGGQRQGRRPGTARPLRIGGRRPPPCVRPARELPSCRATTRQRRSSGRRRARPPQGHRAAPATAPPPLPAQARVPAREPGLGSLRYCVPTSIPNVEGAPDAIVNPLVARPSHRPHRRRSWAGDVLGHRGVPPTSTTNERPAGLRAQLRGRSREPAPCQTGRRRGLRDRVRRMAPADGRGTSGGRPSNPRSPART